ncbi:hypothetical protein ATL17_1610 [Maritalea mobilis]|uniref:Uncharacterized protein n=1 Tax=Maritalea mobilis TaxID=483324 RepID=A0A4R6VN57_9HYPH|nr:hypothetical protein [Maritalea mobilis]TDQ63603.1 hypothetical protein ATL17_1610 [Maritalea mobilis]
MQKPPISRELQLKMMENPKKRYDELVKKRFADEGFRDTVKSALRRNDKKGYKQDTSYRLEAAAN